MGPAVLLGGLIMLSLFVLASALVGIRPAAATRPVAYRYAAPLVGLGMLIVGVVLGVVAHAPPLVVVLGLFLWIAASIASGVA